MVIWSFVLKEHFLYLFKIWDLRVSSQQKVGECRKGRWYCENITQYIKRVLILKPDCEESNKHCTAKRKNEINQVTTGRYLSLLSVLPSSQHEPHLNTIPVRPSQAKLESPWDVRINLSTPTFRLYLDLQGTSNSNVEFLRALYFFCRSSCIFYLNRETLYVFL